MSPHEGALNSFTAGLEKEPSKPPPLMSFHCIHSVYKGMLEIFFLDARTLEEMKKNQVWFRHSQKTNCKKQIFKKKIVFSKLLKINMHNYFNF